MDRNKESDTGPYQPFIKWVGGKRALAAEILKKAKICPEFRFGSYFEPFLGGGAMFFHLASKGAISPGTRVHLSDINGPLIATYKSIQGDLERLLRQLRRHAHNHLKDGNALKDSILSMERSIGGAWLKGVAKAEETEGLERDYYYWVRDGLYNKIKKGYLDTDLSVHIAAAFLYLNRTGFNGMYRENASGFMNIPKGRYANPSIVNEAVLRAAREALQGVDLCSRGYAESLRAAGRGDLVYIDPPYFETFTDYSKGGFGKDEQEELAGLASMAAQRGASVIISNSDTKLMSGLYESRGFSVARIKAARNINSDGAGRAKVSEIIAFRISNT